MKKYLYKLLARYLSFYINENSSVVELCNNNISLLKNNFKNKNYQLLNHPDEIGSSAPDFVLLNSNLHYEKDIQSYLNKIQTRINSDTRLIIVYYSSLWKPIMRLATSLGLRTKSPEENWISHEDIENIFALTGLQIVRRDSKIIFPIYIPLISAFLNRVISPLPFFRLFSLANIVVARSVKPQIRKPFSVSIVVPARNEEGNIEEIARMLPKFTADDELIFVEGNSTDNTWEKIKTVAAQFGGDRKIIITQQDGKGKGDAVRKGFSLATGDVLMIFDADITVPPEDIVKFYDAINDNNGEFINGSRLVYPMEKEAMRFFNMIGNKFFALNFSFIIGQRFKDTLCGTKVLTRKNYNKLIENRKYFGEFDHF